MSVSLVVQKNVLQETWGMVLSPTKNSEQGAQACHQPPARIPKEDHEPSMVWTDSIM
ncbi:Hypothetical predicted protein, partial [Marmota monax]